MTLIASPFVADLLTFGGASAPADAEGGSFDLLLEVPHGATSAADYHAMADAMEGPLPEGLIDFYYVNTDVGAFEVAEAIAARVVAALPSLRVALLRCRIPRTFIDCNRCIDASAEDFRAGGVGPGLMPWVKTASDRRVAVERYDAYLRTLDALTARLSPSGAMLLVHTYAPRTVDVQVDEEVVRNLHAAYDETRFQTWPLRPEVDIVSKSTEGLDLAPAGWVEALRDALAPLPVGESATYKLHPSTVAWRHVERFPGRVLCVEVRRDLLVEFFAPFAPMACEPAKVRAIAHPMADALLPFLRAAAGAANGT